MSKNFRDLPHEEQQRILNKLTRLKALSECKTGNVNETATAAAAMTRLMLEYKIELAELQSGPDAADAVQEQEITEEKGRIPLWHNHLLCCLAEINDCVGFQSTRRNLFRGSSARTLCIVGRPEDIRHTRTMLTFCIAEIERLCHRWQRETPWGVPLARRNDFKMGAAIAVGEKVKLEREQVRAEERARAETRGVASRALAVLDSRFGEAQAAAAKIGVREATPRGRRPLSATAFDAGYQAGKAVQIPRSEHALPPVGAAPSSLFD
jgi:hypothetical protein